MNMKDLLAIIGAIVGAGLVVTAGISVVQHKNKNVVKQKSKGDNSPNTSTINNNGSTDGRQSNSN